MKDDVAATEEVVEEPAQVGLSVSDLANIRNIIDIASQRGAFKANELEVVGNTYNRLNAFLSTVAAQANANAETAEEVAEEEAGEE